MKSILNIKKLLKGISLLFLIYFCINANRIHQFSKINVKEISDVAIVLGAGTNKGKLSPVFKERINHSIELYKNGFVKKIIFTGGFGKGQTISDSQVAKNYALSKAVLAKDILIEEKSAYTIQNLQEAKLIMDSLKLKKATLVSDPLHMKRSIGLARKIRIDCISSPTQTSMYKSRKSKLKSLFYETVFFTVGELSGRN